MSVVMCKKTRRQFLVGAGNTLLALPFLPSLFTSQQAMAQAATVNKRMMLFWYDHSIPMDLWPNSNIATTPVGNVGARETMLSSLPSASAFSPTMTHTLMDTLRRNHQITMVRGLEVLGPGGHGIFPIGGNVDYDAGRIIQGDYTLPTMDSLIEASQTLYPASTPSSVKKVMRVARQYGTPLYFQKVGGQMQLLPAYGTDDFGPSSGGLRLMYNEIFSSLTGGTTPPVDTTNLTKTNILNRVHASYTAFRSNRRISSEDQARVDQHLSMIADLQRRYTATVPVANSCSRPTEPSATISDPTVSTPIYLNLLALAFKCNLSKFGILYFDSHDPRWLPGLNIGGATDFHSAVHGDAGVAAKTNAYTTYHTWGNNQIATHFLAHLNEQEGTSGRTYLDNMLTVILGQMGYESFDGTYGGGHSSYDLHHIMFGSMGGAIRAGRYVYYPPGGTNPGTYRPHMPNNSFLITLFQLLGIPESEYSLFTPGRRGFGYYPASSAGHPYASRFYSPLSEILA